MASLKTALPSCILEGTYVCLSLLLSTASSTVAETMESSAARVSKGRRASLSGTADMTTHFTAMHWCGFSVNMGMKNAFWEAEVCGEDENMT